MTTLGKHWKFSEEAKERMRQARKRYFEINGTGIVKGKNNPMYGKKLTDEHKKKISESLKKNATPEINYKRGSGSRGKPSPLKGRKLSNEQKSKISKSLSGSKNPNWHKKLSQETRNKISKAMKGRPQPRGEKSVLWKGGKRSFAFKVRMTPKYREWREQVFERDNYTCQKCGYKQGKTIEPHHIKSLNSILKELVAEFGEDKFLTKIIDDPRLYDINNGLTLCQTCHKETDNYGHKAK